MGVVQRNVGLDCPFTEAIHLANAGLGGNPAPLRLRLAGASVALRRVCFHARILPDTSGNRRSRSALQVELEPACRFPVPTFKIVITVRPEEAGSELHVEASYNPPLGWFGRACDALLLHFAATSIVEAFVNDVKRLIEGEWSEIRKRTTGAKRSSA